MCYYAAGFQIIRTGCTDCKVPEVVNKKNTGDSVLFKNTTLIQVRERGGQIRNKLLDEVKRTYDTGNLKRKH
jgi:hypothetical protein